MFSTSNHNGLSFGHAIKKLYLLCFLHQTTTIRQKPTLKSCCISYVFYIKPQLYYRLLFVIFVVSLMFSTSNHNPIFVRILFILLYLLCFLHQTTTPILSYSNKFCCISYVFYIKPQLAAISISLSIVVSLMFSTSNHNLLTIIPQTKPVVSLMFSTSNHNEVWSLEQDKALYLLCFLHQTTT